MVAAFDERRRTIVPLLNQLPGIRCLDPGGAFYARFRMSRVPA